MTKQEKDCIFNEVDKVIIRPEDGMNLMEMKAYVKGFEDARNSLFDAIDKCYRSLKTD